MANWADRRHSGRADSPAARVGARRAGRQSRQGSPAVISTLNAAYGVKESRQWWESQLVALGLLIISALALVLYGGGIGLLLAGKLGLGETFTTAWGLLQWPLVLAFVLLAFALAYYFAPNVKDIKWYWITPGSVLGIVLWLLISFAFRAYLSLFDTYSTIYGSFGAVLILLLWLYLTGAAILVGGGLNAVIENAAAEAGDPEAKEHGQMSPGDSGVNATEEARRAGA